MSSIPYDFSREPASVVSHHQTVDESTRRDINRSLSKRVHGVFASRKNRSPVPWRNRHEHALFGLLEIDPQVFSFQAMPEQVRFMFGAVQRSHVPSALVKTHSGPVVMDAVEAEGDIHRCLASVYSARGMAYRAVPSKVLHALPRAENARWVLAHRYFEPSYHHRRNVMSALSGTRSVRPLAELVAASGAGLAEATICSLALDGEICLDLAAVDRSRMAVSLAAGAGR